MQGIATMAARRQPAIVLWLACAAGLLAPTARAQLHETLVSSQKYLIDPEFSQSRAKIAWVDSGGRLWIAGVDRSTGMFVPATGKGRLVDPDAMKTSDFDMLGNGPEWIGTSTGDQLVYTKFLPGLPHQARNARLALAQQSPGGGWSYGYIDPGHTRSTPYASSDAGDPWPRISYVDPFGNHYWRNLYDASSETLVQQFPPSRLLPMSFVKNTRAAAFAGPVDGVSQVFVYWLDENRAEQVTFDDGQKDLHSRPWIWQAPEYGGALVLATVVDDTRLRLYALPPGGSQADWTVISNIPTPQGGLINSPEIFIHNGRSYIFFTASMPPAPYLSTRFLTGIDDSQPMPQQLTPDEPLRVRGDPEVFVANDGPYIYYNRMTVNVEGDAYGNEGIYRAYTGLPPAQ